MTALIELRDIRKSFGPVEVLKGVNMKVQPAKVSALVGDNGAGKATLIKGLAGVQSYDSGEVVFDGEPVTLHTPQDASGLGIEVVYQDLALCENLDIVQNMFLGREEQHHRLLNGPQMERHAAETLGSLSVRTIKTVRQKVSSLSGGQPQTVAIARSVLQKARLVIRDEPTAALGVAQTEQVLQLVRRLADAGVAVVLVSHNMNDVFEVADSINVLYLGQTAAQVRTKDSSRSEVIELITSGSAGMAPGAVAPRMSPDAPERASVTSVSSDATTTTTDGSPRAGARRQFLRPPRHRPRPRCWQARSSSRRSARRSATTSAR